MKRGEMTKIPFHNKELLDKFSYFEQCANEDYLAHFRGQGLNYKAKDAQKWTGLQHLHDILNKRRDHEGFPEQLKSYSLQHNTFHQNVNTDLEEGNEKLREVWAKLDEIKMMMGFRVNALFCVYPPGGFISWHNNANASAYNLIFTWSENGDGGFRYLNRRNSKVVTIRDEPGWQCKAGYFASYDENLPLDLMYHSAYTNCWRITIAFTLDTSESSFHLQQTIIDGISSVQ